MHRLIAILAGVLVCCAVSAAQESHSGIDSLRRAFLEPADDARVMMRWWWFGPAITTEQIVRDLDAMRAGGIGGVEIQPVYPIATDRDAGADRG